jgi:hypothetical protein
LAREVFDALDVGGYLIDPNQPIYIKLDNRTVTHTTELAKGIEVSWCGDIVVGLWVRNWFRVRAAW